MDRLPGTASSAKLQQLFEAVGLPEPEIAWHRSVSQRRRLAKGDVFCEIGQARHEVAHVDSGILQVYMLTSSGDRVVLDFVFPGGIALALDAAVRGRPSEVCFEAVTPCEITAWAYDLGKVAKARHPGWATLETRLMEAAFRRKNQRYITTETLDASERHALLDAELPPEWRKVPQHILASYLRITPQHLSRLKRAARARLSTSAETKDRMRR